MPGDPQMRASDADRERAAALLREHAAVGRLTTEEFDQRLDKVFAAKTIGELDGLLADLPGIDLYRLPSAEIAPRGYRPGGGPGLVRRPDGSLAPFRFPAWTAWTAASALLVVLWLVVGVVAGGATWIPWFLLIVIPWALSIARRPPDHPSDM
jgi:hypothetical protein